MRTYAQILYEKAHWIFEQEAEPDFAPDIIIVDITGLDVEEGWDYDSETGEFTEPVPAESIEPDPSPIELLQQENELLKLQNKALSDRADFTEDLIVEIAMQVYP